MIILNVPYCKIPAEYNQQCELNTHGQFKFKDKFTPWIGNLIINTNFNMFLTMFPAFSRSHLEGVNWKCAVLDFNYKKECKLCLHSNKEHFQTGSKIIMFITFQTNSMGESFELDND